MSQMVTEQKWTLSNNFSIKKKFWFKLIITHNQFSDAYLNKMLGKAMRTYG